MNQSLDNFILDCFVRCFDAKDALYEDIGRLDPIDRKTFASSLFQNRNILEKIYDARIHYIRQNVTLSDGVGEYEIKDIFFHERFGWTVSNGDVKAFLGKSSLSDKIRVQIGNRTYFSGPATLKGDALLRIGNVCSIAECTYMRTERDFHPINWPSTVNFRDNYRLIADRLNFDVDYDELDSARTGIEIGNDVWIARNVRIFHGVTIGDGCVIGEGSLVNKDCEPFGIYAGVPARLIRYRFPEKVREELLQIKWWNWNFKEIHSNADFFRTKLDDFKGSLFDRWPKFRELRHL